MTTGAAGQGEPAPLPPRRVVTVSATYGAGGSVMAPRLAERLGLSFLDRLIPPGTAASLERITEAERAATPINRWLSRLARIPAVIAGAPVAPASDLDPEPELRASSEADVRLLVAAGPALILGHAAAIVLADDPSAFHIRLDGPAERRAARAAEYEGIDVASARKIQADTDHARHAFVRRLYGCDADDPALYHVVLDTTVLPADAVVTLLAEAAVAFWTA